MVVINNVESKDYDTVSDPVVSSDGNQVAYVARIKDKTHYDGKEFDVLFDAIVLNGKEGQRYSSISNLSFSADSKSMSYGAVSTVGDDNILKDNDILWVTESFE